MKTSAKFEARLRGITSHIDEQLEALRSVEYAIGDEIESDECMVCSLETAARMAHRGIAGDDESLAVSTTASQKRSKATSPRDVATFRNKMVTTMTDEAPVNAKFLRQADAHPIVFYAIVLGDDEANRVAYVRHMNPMRLTKPGMVLALLGDSLDDVGANVFMMDDRVDLVIRPDDVVIVNKNFFESLFFDLSGEGEALDRIVQATLSVLPIASETISLLLDRTRGRKRMRRKMLEIRESAHLASVTVDDFKRALAEQGYAATDFIAPNGTITASEDNVGTLLQILNEDIFKGALTGRPLAATRKSTRKGKA
ncbi:MAG: DUF4868 domain-containing protein [Candidatus Eremiobacteraeota bacterium]|nr:DUF4868 domain-containing protein [Candidatus Eremiobacteraeota bacterium]